MLRTLLGFAALALLWTGISTVKAQTLEPVDLTDLSAFSESDGWQTVGDARALWDDDELNLEEGTGTIAFAPKIGAGSDLVSKWEHGDLVLEFDFMLARGSQTGILFQGRYELQIADSWGVRYPSLGDAGAIVPREASGGASFEGHVPRTNAAKAPGLWQHLRVVFEAPRFSENGDKVANAQFSEVVLNSVTIHEAVQVMGPTVGSSFDGESRSGPVVIEGGSPIAIRNIRLRHFEPVEPVRLSDVRYTLYEGEFGSLDDFVPVEPSASGDAFGYVWDLFGRTADRIGLEWEGTIHIPRSGEYGFAMRFNWIDEIPYDEDAVAGRGRFMIDGMTVIEHEGADSTAYGRVHLEAGRYPFSMTYFKNRRLWRPIVFLRVEGPGMPPQYLNARRTLPEPESSSPTVPVDVGREPIVLRSFAMVGDEKQTNVVNVGDPSGIHYALDLNTAAMLYAWKGDFLDVGSMWTGRGQQQLGVPLGQKIRSASGPVLGDASPNGGTLANYSLDTEGRPSFRYIAGGVTIDDTFLPDPEGRMLTRQMTFTRAGGGQSIAVRLAEGREVFRHSDGVYAIDGEYFIDLTGVDNVELRAVDGRSRLVVSVAPDGGPSHIQYDMLW